MLLTDCFSMSGVPSATTHSPTLKPEERPGVQVGSAPPPAGTSTLTTATSDRLRTCGCMYGMCTAKHTDEQQHGLRVCTPGRGWQWGVGEHQGDYTGTLNHMCGCDARVAIMQ
jgi:hypothetical protein